jgi:uncharacterized protein with HEPN domain
LKRREYRDYLHDILNAVNDAESFVGDMNLEQFTQDRKTVNAVVRSLEIIGEAAKNISADMREKYDEVPWKKMAAMRDRVIHGYFGVDNKTLWSTVRNDLPPLKQIVKKMLEDLEKEKG